MKNKREKSRLIQWVYRLWPCIPLVIAWPFLMNAHVSARHLLLLGSGYVGLVGLICGTYFTVTQFIAELRRIKKAIVPEQKKDEPIEITK